MLLTLNAVSVWRPPDTTGAEHLTCTGAGPGTGRDWLNRNLAGRRRRELYHCGDRSHAWGGKQIVPTDIYICVCVCVCGPGSSVGIATDYGLDGPGLNPSGDEIFRLSRPALGPTQPPVKWVPGLSPGSSAARACRWPLTPFWCRGHGRVELYLYSPSWPHRACNGITLPFIYIIYIYICLPGVYWVLETVKSMPFYFINGIIMTWPMTNCEFK